MKKQKILLIGWDAADWNIINPLLDSGQMPALEKLVNEGAMGNIATLEPVLSPMLWTSIATGKYADKHGILGFTDTMSLGRGIQPVLSTSRQTKAIWNILMQNGYKSHVIGWWPSHPAEPLNGITISNWYGKTNSNKKQDELIHENSIHPKEYIKLFKEFRLHPSELSRTHLLPFIPGAQKIDQKKEKTLAVLAQVIAEATNYHSAATWILENEEWDFMAIYLSAIDQICHRFIKFHPPKLPILPNDKYELYKDVVNGIYKYHDMMLEQLLKYTDENTTIVLVSDHGFNSDEKRLIANPKEPAGIAYDHRPYGVFCMKGPGIKKDERIYGASLLDVTPTILHSCGIPLGEDMDGKPLVQIFEQNRKVDRIESWDKLEGDSGFVGEIEEQVTHFTTAEELDQLVELGYIENPGDNVKLAIDKSVKETRYNKARVYINSNRFELAKEELQNLIDDYPIEYRFHVRLAMVLQILHENEKCLELISELKAISEEKKNTRVKKDTKETKPEYKIPVLSLNLLEGNIYLNKNEAQKALEIFNKLEKNMPMNPKIWVQKGKAYLLLFESNKAQEAFTKAIEKDPDNAPAHHGLARAYMNIEKYEESVNSSLDAINLLYYYPVAHYYLGLSLFKLNDFENASRALKVCLSQNINMSKARNLLIKIYNENLNQPEKANELAEYFNKEKNNYITIVSGIPRSGTSLMMQMLEAAGIEPYTDNSRKADVNNEKGYYEHENVKTLAANKSWLKEVGNKSVKIVSQLLFQLPDSYNYKVIFMQRGLKEIIHSQQMMLKNNKGKKIDTFPFGLEKAYETNLKNIDKWVKNKRNVKIQYISYREIIRNPESEIQKLCDFLEKELDTQSMIRIIDPKLYRSVFNE